MLQAVDSVSVTVDIWSDRRMRSYLGLTVHFVEDSNCLSSALLCCERFYGEFSLFLKYLWTLFIAKCIYLFLFKVDIHNISAMFDATVQNFALDGKIRYVISDNAANMAAAFSVAFKVSDDDDDESLLVDDPSLWCSADDCEIEDMTPACTHIRCFAHSLQLVVKNGI